MSGPHCFLIHYPSHLLNDDDTVLMTIIHSEVQSDFLSEISSYSMVCNEQQLCAVAVATFIFYSSSSVL